MSHLYKAEMWQGSSKIWYCNDIKGTAKWHGRWWIPARILNISPADYVKLLIEEFKVDKISFNEDSGFLYFGWSKEADCRKYKNWINKKAREANFIY